jgi:hypothetical protein
MDRLDRENQLLEERLAAERATEARKASVAAAVAAGKIDTSALNEPGVARGRRDPNRRSDALPLTVVTTPGGSGASDSSNNGAPPKSQGSRASLSSPVSSSSSLTGVAAIVAKMQELNDRSPARTEAEKRKRRHAMERLEREKADAERVISMDRQNKAAHSGGRRHHPSEESYDDMRPSSSSSNSGRRHFDDHPSQHHYDEDIDHRSHAKVPPSRQSGRSHSDHNDDELRPSSHGLPSSADRYRDGGNRHHGDDDDRTPSPPPPVSRRQLQQRGHGGRDPRDDDDVTISQEMRSIRGISAQVNELTVR